MNGTRRLLFCPCPHLCVATKFRSTVGGMMVRYATMLTMVLAGLLVTPVEGDVFLNYLGAQDMGDGTFLHEYEGTRDPGDQTPVRDLHIEGQFDFAPGTITLFAPGDWSTTVYTGPGPILYNWQVEQGDPWTSGNLAGFGILVDNPTITSTPFHWTDNPQLPPLPNLGNVIANGVTSVPIPEPATITVLVLGLAGLAAGRCKVS